MINHISTKKAFGITILSLLLSGILTYGTILFFQKGERFFLANYVGLFLGELFLIIPAIIFLSGKISLRSSLRINPIPHKIIVTTVVMSLGVSILVDELDRIIAIIIPPPDFLIQIIHSLKAKDTTSLILIFLGGVLLAAVSEELLFRGFLQQILEKQWANITKAVLVTSLFFAVIHMNPWWIIQIYLMGVILGFLAWRTNSVFPCIIFHGINNGLAFAYSNFGDSIESWYLWKGHVSPIPLICAIILTFLGFKHLAIEK